MAIDRDYLTRRRAHLALPLLALASLALPGCGSVTRGGAAGTAAVPPATATVRPSPLAIERQWLQSWFRGAPVAITQRGDSAVSVEVPREFSFEPGRSQVKPGLAAVLDKVAESLRRLPQARLPLAAAPGDMTMDSPLALQRANQMRAQLLQRGVSAAQMGPPTATTAAVVQLRLETGGSH